MNLFLITFLLFSFLTVGAWRRPSPGPGGCDRRKCRRKCEEEEYSIGVCHLIRDEDGRRRPYWECVCRPKRI
ncbi:unnamed protein product [Cylicocyclus nassatus]|uniref:Uncharacterized protein n=1 Tax=Cylicocyclus nassatus TaxID=53992 RepID=A0AA36GNY7_CYLNA|nr:unnamed protein product [Cylicocyclus nassatus]